MGKIFSKVVGLSVGLSLAIGLGVAAKGVRKEASRANADSASFVKITSNDDLTDGEYLIVCESQSVAFNGGLATLDAVSNTIAVSPSSSSITANAVTTAATFTWDGTEGSLLSKSGKYIGRKATSNGLNSATTFSADYANTISIDDSGNADIAGAGGLKLRYNKSSGQTRFRYFTSAQESIQLYKLVGSASTKFAVIYNGNGSTGGAVPTDSNEYDSGDEVTVLGNTGSLVKTGYTFGGWNTNADGTGTNYLADETFEITATTTLYAKWVPNKHTLTYSINGGTGEISAPTQYDYNEQVTLASSEGLSREGYVFGGWNTSADGTGENHAAGSKYTIKGDVTLYAKWNVPRGEFALVESASDLSIGDEIAIVSSGTGSKKAMSTTQNNNNRGATPVTVSGDYTFEVTDDVQLITLGKENNHWTFGVDGGYLYAASSSSNYLKTREENSDGNSEWEITITDGIASIVAQGSYTHKILKNNGDLFSCYTSGQTDVSIYKEAGAPATKYSVIDRIDNGSLNKDEVKEGSTLSVTIVPDDGYELPSSLTQVLMGGSPVAYTYVDGVVTVQNVTGNVTIEGACIKTNPIKALYSKAAEASVDVYGYYVGFLDGTGPVIMDGEYGVVVYDKTADVSSYTEKETVLHVTGQISIYNGLYEIASPTIDVATGEYEAPAAPVVYSVAGGETAEYASRLTTVSGTVKSVTISTPKDKEAIAPEDYDWDPTAEDRRDATVVMTVNDHDINVFLKKASQTVAIGNAIMTALNSNPKEEITVKGFTGWYKGFQVQMTDIVEAKQDYTAEQFAQDLLNQTDAVCTGWKEGDNNHDAIEAIWSDLASDDKYPSLPSDQKTILAQAARNQSGTVVERAMARYDYLTGRYNLSNFINGRTPITSGSANMFIVNDNNIITMVVILASLLTVSCAALLALKKRKIHR